MKKILITGASDGIGLEIARALAREGNQLVLVARNQEKLKAAIESLPGQQHSFVLADLTLKEDVERVASHIDQNHFDVLINNAGVGMYGRFEEMPLAEQEAMMRLNMLALTILSYNYLKNARRGDCLVNISSVLGTTSCPGAAVYSATKAFVTNFSEALWRENKSRGVFVLGFCPGVTRTHFHEVSGGSQDMFPTFIVQTPSAVAAEFVRALNKRNKPKAVSGGTNRFMLFFHRLLTRKMVVNMMGGFSPVKNL
jgi:short-subunit dehydrogenase